MAGVVMSLMTSPGWLSRRGSRPLISASRVTHGGTTMSDCGRVTVWRGDAGRSVLRRAEQGAVTWASTKPEHAQSIANGSLLHVKITRDRLRHGPRRMF